MRKKMFLPILLLPLLLNLATINAVKATPTSVMSIEPGFIWDLDMVPGTQFTVAVYVDYAERVWLYQFDLGEPAVGIPGWDPTVLHLVSVDNGPFLGSRGGSVVFSPGVIDNNVGVLWLTIGYLDPNIRWPTGGGDLAYLTFEVVGYGITSICFGLDSGLMDYRYRWIIRGTYTPEALKCGFFANVEGPLLEFPHGVSGVWEEYQVILEGETQTSYAKIRNWGTMGAWVEVDFIVRGPEGINIYRSNRAWVDPRTYDPATDEWIPGEAIVSASYVPGAEGKYWVKAHLYFQVEEMPEMVSYSLVVDELGGEAVTKDTNVAFKVKASA
jgi:hypothetical protein